METGVSMVDKCVQDYVVSRPRRPQSPRPLLVVRRILLLSLLIQR